MQNVKLIDSLTPVLSKHANGKTTITSVRPDIITKMVERGGQCGPWKDIDGGKMQVWYRPGKDSNDV